MPDDFKERQSEGLKIWWKTRRVRIMNWQEKCIDMWGEYHWMLILSLTARCSKRTVQRWRKGEFKINQDVVDKIDATHKIWKGDQDGE